jgi:hypothetical protein
MPLLLRRRRIASARTHAKFVTAGLGVALVLSWRRGVLGSPTAQSALPKNAQTQQQS